MGFDGAGLVLLALLLVWRGVSWREAFGMQWRGLPRQFRAGVVGYLATLPILFFAAIVYQGVLTWP